MRRSVLLIVLLSTHFVLCGQSFDTESHDDGDEIFYKSTGTLDERVFDTPGGSAPDPFYNISKYRFGAVRYRPRGLDARHERVVVGGVELSEGLSPRPDWELTGLLRRSGHVVQHLGAMTATDTPAGLGPSERYSLAVEGDELRVSVRASNRYSRLGGDLRWAREWNNGWSHRLSIGEQGGGDGTIRGLSSDGLGGTAAVTKRWRGGASLTFFAAGGFSERGLRSAATREAFTLTGDGYYNPAWGWQGSRRRNCRVAQTVNAFAACTFETPLGAFRTLSATLAVRGNRSGRSRLAWWGVSSPLPDYYRQMPSWFPEWSASEIVAEAWRTQDPEVTQIDWRKLYRINSLSPDGEATYIVERQVERQRNIHLNAVITRRISGELELSYGVRLSRLGSRFFKEAADMLGAVWVSDVDNYATDRGTPTEGVEQDAEVIRPGENDLRNPGLLVGQGERFGYDYLMGSLRGSVHGVVRWHREGFGVTASGSLTRTSMRRRGFYENGCFPGEGSFGPSRRAGFTTWSAAVSGWWRAALRHTVEVKMLAGSETPFVNNIFISPERSNIVVGEAAPSGIYGTEASWCRAGATIDVRVAGFVNATTGETLIRAYWDDLAGTSARMVMRGASRVGFGVEVGVEARATRWLTIVAGASAGRYSYNSSPRATIYGERTGEVISKGVVCHMKGVATGLPQMVAALELVYSNRRRWRASLGAEWAGGRHIEPNPLYRSSRIEGINPSPEIMREFTSQQRLVDSFTLGASLSKGFVLPRGYLVVAATVRNLTSATIVHSAWEQMRIMRRGSGITQSLVPFPPKYLRSHPFTWSLSVTYTL